MRKLIIIIIVLIANVANAQKDTIPDSESQPWYGTRHIVNMSGTDTMAFYQPGDTAHIVANDSIYVHKLLNHDINAGGDTPTLQEVTDAGNTTDNSIGLGTTPISNIHVKKTNPSIRVESESGQIGEFILQNPDKLWEITNDGTDNNKFKITDVSSASDRLVIESSGNVGIGTTSPSEKLDVNGNGIFSGNLITQDELTIQSDYDEIQMKRNGGQEWRLIGGNYWSVYDQSNGVYRFHVGNDGDVGIGKYPGATLDVNGNATADNFILSSDRRLKSNITPIQDALTKALFLNPISFTYKDGRESIGFTAQNVQKMFPELVHKGSDGYLSLSYDQITAVNNAAIHELYSEIEKIKKENKRLKNEIQELKSKINEICKQLEE